MGTVSTGLAATLLLSAALLAAAPRTATYVVTDTGQAGGWDEHGRAIETAPGEPLHGQDGDYAGPAPRYRDNQDGTISDLNTGLMWQKMPDLWRKSTYEQAVAAADGFRLAGHDDWRLPGIKELYSLIDFSGNCRARPPVPYLDIRFFGFAYGQEQNGERMIDAQFVSSTTYLGRTMGGQETVFGVNFADGRIKGYPRGRDPRGHTKTFYVRYVRGNPVYGRNEFADNADGTITDRATGLTWTKTDSGRPLDWPAALAWAEHLELAGHSDWRLPNAKELQSIVDYDRAPEAEDPAQRGPAIDPLFELSDPEGWFWTGTTHLEAGPSVGSCAVYIAFGRATGQMEMPPGSGRYRLLDVHGAGAQRSDPKVGDPADWPHGLGPQGDTVRIHNYARAVRGGP